MFTKSIRWRMQIWHGLILVLVLIGFGVTAYQVVEYNQAAKLDQELSQRLAFTHLARRGDGPPPDLWGPGKPPMGRPPGDDFKPDSFGPGDRHRERGPPRDLNPMKERWRKAFQAAIAAETGATNDYYYVLWQEDGKDGPSVTSSPGVTNVPPPRHSGKTSAPNARGPRGDPFGPMSEGDFFTQFRTRGEFREAYRFLPFGDCALVGHSMVSDWASMHRLAVWLVAAGAAVLLLGLAGGWWVATRAIRPIEAISATAGKIADGDLSQRIDATDTESELGRLAGVLNSTFARLEAAFGQQRQFVADASHELRTPIAVIISEAQTTLARERSAAEYRETVEACLDAAQQMRRLTRSLLELARYDAGQEAFERQPFDLAAQAQTCLELIAPLARERGIQIHSDLRPAEVCGDADRLGQVLINLLTNAIHYNKDNGEIRVSTNSEPGAVVLTVADTGQGIPAEDLPHVFERFYRADKSRSRAAGRYGLGLAIVKAILDAHAATIEATSEVGRGTCFTIRLPR